MPHACELFVIKYKEKEIVRVYAEVYYTGHRRGMTTLGPEEELPHAALQPCKDGAEDTL